MYTHLSKCICKNVCMLLRQYITGVSPNAMHKHEAQKVPTRLSLAADAVSRFDVMDCASGSVPRMAQSFVDRCLRITLKKHNIGGGVHRGL